MNHSCEHCITTDAGCAASWNAEDHPARCCDCSDLLGRQIDAPSAVAVSEFTLPPVDMGADRIRQDLLNAIRTEGGIPKHRAIRVAWAVEAVLHNHGVHLSPVQ